MAPARDEPERGGLTPEGWERVREILDGALALDSDTRGEYLDTTCAHDDLRRKVESLLASSVPESRAVPGHAGASRPGPAPAELESLAGRRVGPYELLAVIGHGGMGEVYRARRADGQYDQQVAIRRPGVA